MFLDIKLIYIFNNVKLERALSLSRSLSEPISKKKLNCPFMASVTEGTAIKTFIKRVYGFIWR